MATTVRGWQSVKVFLEMIKFEHSIFALPFAMIGMIWGSRSVGGSGWPGWATFAWIVVAMVSCRSAAMAFNRIADRDIDAKNPRTKIRAIPAGILSLNQVNLFFFISCALFFLAAGMLNPLTLLLSPVALGITLFYSRTKRFTPLCHFVLGLSLGIAPAAAWIATTGKLGAPAMLLTLAIVGWTAGFDIIYALQDEDFDRAEGLRSIPETFGKVKALTISRGSHVAAVAFLAGAAAVIHVGILGWVGVVLAAGLLIYEQSLVKPNDLSKVNLAFFTLNGFVSLAVFGFVLLDVLFSK